MSRLVAAVTAVLVVAVFAPAALAAAPAAPVAVTAGAQAAPLPVPEAQTPAPSEPQIGQAGKDVIWLPTPESVVEGMLTMAKVTPSDVVYDLGSGDGRTVIAAAKRGAQAYGVEFDPGLVALSEKNARSAGVADKAHFVQGDIFQTDFSRATVVTLYLLTTLNVRLRPLLLAMPPGTRVVSHAFTMEDWEPDEKGEADYRHIYMWIVPAHVEGPWRLEMDGSLAADMDLTQTYQKLRGTVALPGGKAELRDGVLHGDAIRFTIADANGATRELSGKVTGSNNMSGTLQADGKPLRWRAVRR